jgi:hypothetical protein
MDQDMVIAEPNQDLIREIKELADNFKYMIEHQYPNYREISLDSHDLLWIELAYYANTLVYWLESAPTYIQNKRIQSLLQHYEENSTEHSEALQAAISQVRRLVEELYKQNVPKEIKRQVFSPNMLHPVRYCHVYSHNH